MSDFPSIEQTFANLKAEIIEDCVDAIAQRPAGESGEIPSEPRPTGGGLLSDEEYLDAYMAGLRRSNQAARDAIWRKAKGDVP